jgi:hypothetical protein
VLTQEIARASSNATKNVENPQAQNTFEILATQVVSAIYIKHCSFRQFPPTFKIKGARNFSSKKMNSNV